MFLSCTDLSEQMIDNSTAGASGQFVTSCCY